MKILAPSPLIAPAQRLHSDTTMSAAQRLGSTAQLPLQRAVNQGTQQQRVAQLQRQATAAVQRKLGTTGLGNKSKAGIGKVTTMGQRAAQLSARGATRGSRSLLQTGGVAQRTLDEAKERLAQNAGNLEGYNAEDCGTGAYYAFATLSNTSMRREEFLKLNNKGIDSLASTMERYAHEDTEFIYYINADGLVGHRFTILQNGEEGAIFQGYSGEYSVESSLPNNNTPISSIITNLRTLVNKKSEYTAQRGQEEGIEEELLSGVGKAHQELFLLPISAMQDLTMLYKPNMFDTQDDIEWHVQTTNGQALPKAPRRCHCVIL